MIFGYVDRPGLFALALLRIAVVTIVVWCGGAALAGLVFEWPQLATTMAGLAVGAPAMYGMGMWEDRKAFRYAQQEGCRQ